MARSAAWDVTAPVTTAVEMPALWKPHPGFHSALEISHRARDSHIPTADPRGAVQKDAKATEEPDRKVLPMVIVTGTELDERARRRMQARTIKDARFPLNRCPVRPVGRVDSTHERLMVSRPCPD